MASSWEEQAAEKRTRIENSIPPEWIIQDLPSGDSVINFPSKSGHLSPQELEITNSSATDLVKKLATGDLKSVDVTLAFCKRAALAHQLVGLHFLYIISI
jgi:amidase